MFKSIPKFRHNTIFMSRCFIKINFFVIALFTVLLISFGSAQAQVQKAHPNVSITSNTNGFYDYLPQGYSATGTTLYPLLIFVHGRDEAGNGGSQLTRVLKHGPPKLINAGTFPTSFSVGGKTFKFIVLAPQFINNASASNINGVINYALAHYKVDPKRIYLTGLSAGGGTIENTAADPTVGKRIAALVEFAGSGTPSATKGATIAANNVAFWGIHNKYDGLVSSSKTINFVDYTLAAKPTANAKKTITGLGGGTSHDCWTSRYQPTWKENNLNIYEWMLQYARGTVTTPTNTAPIANAGSDKTITLPTNSVTLSGSATDANGTISKYSWTKTAGPATYTFSSTSVAAPTVRSLIAGTYTFRLTVTDNAGTTDYDDVNVVVKSAPTSSTQPTVTKIEAENYSSMSGIQTQATTDAGGGKNVGFIDQGDWMTYTINAAAAGNYTFTFRLASPNTGGQFKVLNAAGTALATVTVPNTGNWQTWRDVTASVRLSAGSQVLKISSTAVPHWNLNYFKFSASGATSAAIASTEAAEETTSKASSAAITPNPFADKFVLTVNNNLTGIMKVQLIDINGVVRKEFKVMKAGTGTMQNYLSAGALPAGTYFIKAQMGSWSQSKQIVKL